MARGQLQRGAIVCLALDIADREGVDAVSFRRLALELRATPMALYRHVRDKADLLDAMTDLLLQELELPTTSTGDWVAQLRTVLRSFLQLQERHPSTSALLRGRPIQSPQALQAAEVALDILRRAGFPTVDAARILQQLAVLLTAPATRLLPAALSRGEAASADWHALSDDVYPRLREAAEHLGAWQDPARDRDFGVELLLAGLQALLRQRSR